MRVPLPPLPTTPSWRGDQLKLKTHGELHLYIRFAVTYRCHYFWLCNAINVNCLQTHLGQLKTNETCADSQRVTGRSSRWVGGRGGGGLAPSLVSKILIYKLSDMIGLFERDIPWFLQYTYNVDKIYVSNFIEISTHVSERTPHTIFCELKYKMTAHKNIHFQLNSIVIISHFLVTRIPPKIWFCVTFKPQLDSERQTLISFRNIELVNCHSNFGSFVAQSFLSIVSRHRMPSGCYLYTLGGSEKQVDVCEAKDL
jgi:hypothetical protein